MTLLQVEGAVTRAYNRWIEDLTSLPEYQAGLQTEKEKWEEQQEQHTEQRVLQIFIFCKLKKVSLLLSGFSFLIACFF